MFIISLNTHLSYHIVSIYASYVHAYFNIQYTIIYILQGKPSMGSLALSTISSIGRDKGIPATTQLLGGSNEEDMIVGQQISARLAKKIGWPIFISCSLNSSGGSSNDLRGEQEGSDLPAMSDADDSMQHHAAALAEKEVARILLHEKSIIS